MRKFEREIFDCTFLFNLKISPTFTFRVCSFYVLTTDEQTQKTAKNIFKLPFTSSHVNSLYRFSRDKILKQTTVRKNKLKPTVSASLRPHYLWTISLSLFFSTPEPNKMYSLSNISSLMWSDNQFDSSNKHMRVPDSHPHCFLPRKTIQPIEDRRFPATGKKR